jgi:hypothetical protein
MDGCFDGIGIEAGGSADKLLEIGGVSCCSRSPQSRNYYCTEEAQLAMRHEDNIHIFFFFFFASHPERQEFLSFNRFGRLKLKAGEILCYRAAPRILSMTRRDRDRTRCSLRVRMRCVI